MRTKPAGWFYVAVLPWLISACWFFGPGEPSGPGADPQPSTVTCSRWNEMADQQRLALVDRVVGDSAELLERVRIRQHQPLGTPRDSLLVDVAQSLTKMCGV